MFKLQIIVLSTWKISRSREFRHQAQNILHVWKVYEVSAHCIWPVFSARSNKLQLSILFAHLNKLNTLTLLEKVYIYLRFLRTKNLWHDIRLSLFTWTKVLYPIPHNIPEVVKKRLGLSHETNGTNENKVMTYTLHDKSVVDIIPFVIKISVS